MGNIALALAGCIMLENGKKLTEDVSGFLLIKDHEGWRIAAQAWDYVDNIEAAFEAAGLAVLPEKIGDAHSGPFPRSHGDTE